MPESGPRIVAFAGSVREASLNRRLLRYAIEGCRGGLPLYSGDLEDAVTASRPRSSGGGRRSARATGC